MNEDDKRRIARINEISALARGSWIGLLAYLAFVFVTLLGVQDADFFVPSRQTQLPLVNVSIPTASFFYFAPILASALYIYLHLFLLKLWDAIAAAEPVIDDQPLGDVIHPWLVNTLATSMMGGDARSERPLDWLSNAVTALLVWIAGPFVIGWAWWRSMPAHDEALTGMIAFALLASLLACATSWWRARARFRQDAHETWKGRWKRIVAGMVLFLIISFSWLRTENGLDDLIPGFTRPVEPEWLHHVVGWTMLAPTDLAGDALGAVPSGWQDHDIARRRHRETWCRGRDIALETCDLISVDTDAAASAWCAEESGPGQSCGIRFAALLARLDEEWSIDRAAYLGDLVVPDQRGRDLRGADLSDTFLVGADLREARLEGADLMRARLEGADLGWARLDGANLTDARLEGADLAGAGLDGAKLGQARLGNADLNWARLDGANLMDARLEGASLLSARLEGAHLMGARLEGANLADAWLEGANLMSADLRNTKWQGIPVGAAATHSADLRGGQILTQAQLDQFIGDESTLLPEGLSETGAPFHVWTCWETPPSGIDGVATMAGTGFAPLFLARFVCGPGNPRRRTGTPLAADAPYPEAHPLADRH